MSFTSQQKYHLPQDLLLSVLSRLPVKSLLRFKCVSKLWLDLMDSPYFIALHLNYSKQSSTNVKIMATGYTSSPGRSFYVLNMDHDSKAELRRLNYPNTRGLLSKFVGTCNGLICLVLFKESRGNNAGFVIWNPSTNKHRNIVAVHMADYSGHGMCGHLYGEYGFGYDHKTDDYKLLMRDCIECKAGRKGSEILRTYSLKSYSWSCKTTSKLYGLDLLVPSVFAGGFVYWLAHRNGDDDGPYRINQCVIGVDLASEDWCDVIRLPVFEGISRGWTLSPLGDSLCATLHHFESVDVWVMARDGTNKSWNRLFSLADNCFATSPRLGRLEALAYAKDGGQIVLVRDNGTQVKLCDIEKEIAMDVSVSGEFYLSKAFPCIESLVPV